MSNIKKKNTLGVIFFVIGIVGFILAVLFFIVVLSHFDFNFKRIITYINNSFINFLFLVVLFIVDLLLIYIGKKISYNNLENNSEEENKKITKYIIVSIMVIVIILIISPFIYGIFKGTFLCVKEGQVWSVGKSCCIGLKVKGACNENGVCIGSVSHCVKE